MLPNSGPHCELKNTFQDIVLYTFFKPTYSILSQCRHKRGNNQIKCNPSHWLMAALPNGLFLFFHPVNLLWMTSQTTSLAQHCRCALGTFVVTEVTALTWRFDLHRHWNMKYRWSVYLRHMLRESACPAYKTKPGVTTFHICIWEASQKHNDPARSTKTHTKYLCLCHIANMHSCSLVRHVNTHGNTGK